MLSVVLYGRNDSHGYNLHKRAAISLNAIAELLTDPDDEILFVDYNTPDEQNLVVGIGQKFRDRVEADRGALVQIIAVTVVPAVEHH